MAPPCRFGRSSSYSRLGRTFNARHVLHIAQRPRVHTSEQPTIDVCTSPRQGLSSALRPRRRWCWFNKWV